MQNVLYRIQKEETRRVISNNNTSERRDMTQKSLRFVSYITIRSLNSNERNKTLTWKYTKFLSRNETEPK